MNKSVICGLMVAGFTVFSGVGMANAECFSDFGYLKKKIESGHFKNSRDRDNLVLKAGAAEEKYGRQKYSDSL